MWKQPKRPSKINEQHLYTRILLSKKKKKGTTCKSLAEPHIGWMKTKKEHM